MLLLTQVPGQSIEIVNTDTGELITVATISIRGNKVRLGFQADDCYSIKRDNIKNPVPPKHRK